MHAKRTTKDSNVTKIISPCVNELELPPSAWSVEASSTGVSSGEAAELMVDGERWWGVVCLGCECVSVSVVCGGVVLSLLRG